MPTLQLLLLGALDIRYDDQPLSKPPTLKAQSLLAYLATHRQLPQPRERLATLFWGDQPERKARSSLSTALWHIRRCFPALEPILSDPNSVQFDPACDLWLDFEAFESCVNAEDTAHLKAGLALYRGEFMEGFYDDWILIYRYRLESLYSEALARLMSNHEAQRDDEAALATALKLADHDPLREDAHCVAMRAYYRLGQRSAALKQYARCQAILLEELGIEPTTRTTQLYQAILKNQELPARERSAPGEGHLSTPIPDATRRRHNLPVQPTPFVGREPELAELSCLLADPEVRLLTILGAGGMGKTRLALEAGWAQVDDFDHGVYFVPLAPLGSVEEIVPTTAEALGFSFYEGVDPQQQLLEYLRRKRLLLIMDNFEHLLACPEPSGSDGADLVSDVLSTASDVKILATSRARLNVQGECRFHLAGLDFPGWETSEEPIPSQPRDAADPEGRTEYSAVKLFLQSARHARPAFEPEMDDLKHIAHICRLVGGMPLGILLAAGWLEMLAPAEVAAEIEASLDFLETDLRDLPERQRSMRAVFDHSWKLLAEREQEVFQRLSVFRGGFTRQAAQRVAGASLRELRALGDKSLLQRDTVGRYGTHELLRQYAADRLHRAEKLREADKSSPAEQLMEVPAEEQAARDRHCAYYASFLQQREARLAGSSQHQALAEIGVEIENVRAAWSWAVAQGRIEEMDLSLESLAEFCRLRGWFQEGEETFARAAQRLAEVQGTVKGPTVRMILGKVLLQQGRFCDLLGLTEKASSVLQKSLVILRELGARREMAYALYYLGWTVPARGEGEPLFQEGLHIFEDIGDRRGIALSLSGLGWVAWHQGKHEEVKQLFQQCLAISREVGNLRGTADPLYRLALNAAGLEESGEAKQMLMEGLAILREIGYLRRAENVVGDSSEMTNVLGEYAEAIQFAQESLVPAQEPDSLPRMSRSFRVLGEAACGLGDFPGARKHFRKSLEAVATIRALYYLLLALVRTAALLAAEGERERALELLALVLHHPASWQHTRDRAASLVAELEAELPSAVAAAAWERGRAQDLSAAVAELLDELAETDSFDQPTLTR